MKSVNGFLPFCRFLISIFTLWAYFCARCIDRLALSGLQEEVKRMTASALCVVTEVCIYQYDTDSSKLQTVKSHLAAALSVLLAPQVPGVVFRLFYKHLGLPSPCRAPPARGCFRGLLRGSQRSFLGSFLRSFLGSFWTRLELSRHVFE